MRDDPKTVSVTIPSPNQGWNQIDCDSSLQPDEALKLINLWPDRDVSVRNGYASFGTGVGAGAVESIATLALRQGSAKFKLIAVGADKKFYDCSATGAGTEITGGTAPSSNCRYQSWTACAGGSNYQIFANGTDKPQSLIHDGTSTWTRADWSITGPTTTTVCNGTWYRSRQYIICTDSQSVWYGPLLGVTGAFTELDLGPQLHKGGSLQCIGTVSCDTGIVLENMLVLMSDTGEILVYEGDYPGNQFSIKARLYVGPPLGKRAFINIPNDLLIIAQDGLFSLRMLLEGGEVTPLSSPINTAWIDATTAYGTNFGWSGVYYPALKAVIINVPLADNALAEQYVMNMNIKRQRDGLYPWARFVNQNANQFVVHNRALYFGGAGGVVYKADSGSNDNNSNISWEYMSGYQYYGDTQFVKQFDGIRPNVTISGTTQILAGIATDFSDKPLTAGKTYTLGIPTTWDSAWDSPWSEDNRTVSDWIMVTGVGVCGAVKMSGSIKDSTFKFNAAQLRFKQGAEY